MTEFAAFSSMLSINLYLVVLTIVRPNGVNNGLQAEKSTALEIYSALALPCIL